MKPETLGVVVLAAGRGERMGASIPKAYLPLCGKPILWYSLDKLSSCSYISEIAVVIHPEDRPLLRKILDAFSFEKKIQVTLGGEHRQDSSHAGVRAVRSKWVAVHDGARPLFSLELLKAVFDAARAYRAAVPALRVHETVKSIDSKGFAVGEVDREMLYLAQTPQCFERDLLGYALDEAHKQGRYFTDEAGAVSAMSGVRAKIVPGEAQNIKITTPWDLKLAEAILKRGLEA